MVDNTMRYEQMDVFDLLRQKDNERVVEEIRREVAKDFVERIHYSRKFPRNTIHAYGLYKGGY